VARPLLFRTREVRVMEHRSEVSDAELESIMSVAQERAKLLDDMEAALLSGDDEEVKKIARRLCGIDEKGKRI
jgi:hypothetical protein